MMTAFAILAAFSVCWLTLVWLLRRGGRIPMDYPNERSLHATPTPRIGGIGIMAGVAAASLVLADFGLLPVMLGAFALAGVSLADDVRGLPVRMRFLAHFVAASGCLFALGLTGWTLLAGTLVVVWMTNLYNFMDGSDGLAGGMTAIGFGALSGSAWLGGALGLAVFSATIAAAALAFLRYNFPPARLFMGDAGSIPLGFLAATMGILGVRQGVWHWSLPLLAFSPFIVDASVTLARRALHGEKVWRAHRDHYYQRLVRMGYSHRRLAGIAFALMGVAALSGLAMGAVPEARWGVLVGWAIFYTWAMHAIDRRWEAHIHAI